MNDDTYDDVRQEFLDAHPQFTAEDFESPGDALIDAFHVWRAKLAAQAELERRDPAFKPRLPGESLLAFRLRTGLRR